MDTDKDLQRRELVFRVLDDLKSRGERINADKVARLAKMGKQTVLPHYNEWRFLDDAEREVDEDLPADLVRVLKRGLVQWKHQIAESQRSFEEQANNEIDELQMTVQQLTEERIQLAKELSEQKEHNSQLQQQLDESLQTSAEQEKQLVAVTTELKSETNKTDNLLTQLEIIKKDHKDALLAQEKQLDTQHHSQISHWMKVVDDERRLRADLEQQLKTTKESQLNTEKERNNIENRLESKSKAHLEACEERNVFRKQLKEQEPVWKVAHELELLTKLPAENLVSEFHRLTDARQEVTLLSGQLDQATVRGNDLQKQLAEAKEKLGAMSDIAMELEKQKGYSQALEVSLKQVNTLMKSRNET
ncbi:MAG: hypothetical protein ACR2PT_17190 [Endozoicomonas sp.]